MVLYYNHYTSALVQLLCSTYSHYLLVLGTQTDEWRVKLLLAKTYERLEWQSVLSVNKDARGRTNSIYRIINLYRSLNYIDFYIFL